MLTTIAKPFGMLLLWLYNLVNNYGIAIFLFALVVKLILLPFQMKSKKSMMRMSALQPQVAELQKRHEGNPRKLQEETSKLYKEEHVNPMSGCLWSLIPFPILIALYQAIRQPLSVMMRVPKELLEEGGAILTKLTELGFDEYVANAGLSSRTLSGYLELVQSQFISAAENWPAFQGIHERLVQINYRFLGMNLGDMPKLKFWEGGITWAAVGLFLIPLVSAFLSWLQMKLSQNQQQPAPGQNQQQAAQQMKMMNLMMPAVSIYICFIMPAALGMYWIYNSILAIIQELILNKIYGKQMEAEKAAREEKYRLRQAEYERKRQETERLRAEGKTQENDSTSKKKKQARAKAELDELKAAAVREEKAAKRARLGIAEEEEIPASQVGNRRFARGRAYVPDRFTNPERAEEATAAAAARSEADAALMAEQAGESEATEAIAETAAAPAVSDAVSPADDDIADADWEEVPEEESAEETDAEEPEDEEDKED